MPESNVINLTRRLTREDLERPLSNSAPLVLQERESEHNKALKLALHERFFEMAKSILWGSENEEEFGEMLRSLVVAFLPENRFHLQLLKNIAAIQWNIERFLQTQHNLFEDGAAVRGKHGLPQGTYNALEFRPTLQGLQKDLDLAVSTYLKAKRGMTKVKG